MPDPNAARKGVRRALLVHNSRFTDTRFHPLPAADEDVSRLKDLLTRDYVGFAPEHVQQLSNPSLTDFRRAVSRFYRDAGPDDYLFFYYAGHGIRGETGDLYLALRHTSMEDYEAMALEASFIRRNLERCLSQKKIVVLDCCNAGAFRDHGKVIARDVGFDPGLMDANFDPKGTGTYVLGASQSGASAFETTGADGRPVSLFTDAFIRGVESGAAAPGQEVINLIDISRFIHTQRNNLGEATRPFIDITNAVGLLEFARNPVLATTSGPATPEVSATSDIVARMSSDAGHTWRPRRGLLTLVSLAGGAVLAGVAFYLSGSDFDLSDVRKPEIGIVETPEGTLSPAPGAPTIIAPTSGNPVQPADVPKRMVMSAKDAMPEIPNDPHALICSANPSLDLDLSDRAIWQAALGPEVVLYEVNAPHPHWDRGMKWISPTAEGVAPRAGILRIELAFCSCTEGLAEAVIDKLRAEAGFALSLGADRAALNFQSGQHTDMQSTHSTPYSGKLASVSAGNRMLVLEIDARKQGVPFGYAVAGHLRAAKSYVGRCRN